MVPEASFEQTEHGLVPSGEGWYVLNARDARWWDREGGAQMGMQGKADFPQLGVGLYVLARARRADGDVPLRDGSGRYSSVQ